MKITACPKCGSRRIFQGRLKEGVLTGYTTKYVCRDCGYQGFPLIFDSEKEYKIFLKELKSNGKANYSKKSQKLTEKDKEEDDEKDFSLENKSKFFKNFFAFLGVIVFVVGILVAPQGAFLTLYGIALIFVGGILFIIGILSPKEVKLSNINSSKPIFGGIFLMMAGILGVITWLNFFDVIEATVYEPILLERFGLFVSPELLSNVLVVCGVLGLFFSVLSILGGILSIKGKNWRITILCGIFGILTLGPYLSSTILSLVALFLISYSKDSFFE